MQGYRGRFWWFFTRAEHNPTIKVASQQEIVIFLMGMY
jgi:hypothetical protein